VEEAVQEFNENLHTAVTAHGKVRTIWLSDTKVYAP
jgi:hypothetical protein